RGARVRSHAHDRNASHAELARDFAAQHVVGFYAQAGRRVTARRDELRDDAIDRVDRYREADTRVRTRRAVDGGVDADQPTGAVEQRSARIAWIDRRVRLDQVLDDATLVTAQRAIERR